MRLQKLAPCALRELVLAARTTGMVDAEVFVDVAEALLDAGRTFAELDGVDPDHGVAEDLLELPAAMHAVDDLIDAADARVDHARTEAEERVAAERERAERAEETAADVALTSAEWKRRAELAEHRLAELERVAPKPKKLTKIQLEGLRGLIRGTAFLASTTVNVLRSRGLIENGGAPGTYLITEAGRAVLREALLGEGAP